MPKGVAKELKKTWDADSLKVWFFISHDPLDQLPVVVAIRTGLMSPSLSLFYMSRAAMETT